MHPETIDPAFDRIESDAERREAWMRAVSSVVVPRLDPDVPVPRTARFHSWRVGGVVLNEIRASAQSIERTAFQIGSQGVDHVLVRLFASGRTALVTPKGDAPIGVGAIGVFDLTRRSHSRSKGMSGLNIIVPRRRFDARVGDVAHLHQSIASPRGRPLVRLLADHMRNTRACVPHVDAAQKRLLSDGTIALLNATLTPRGDSAYDAPTERMIEIRQFIEANLGRADLGVETICARFGMSRTRLFVRFEAEGGVMAYIRNRRLAKAMRELSGVEGGPRRRISEIAYACGYDNLKSFSFAFRARYGVVPRDVDGAWADAARWETGATLLAWIEAL
ncbi:MAG: AraC family transcriptional regulator [Methylobacterium radiotolerans]